MMTEIYIKRRLITQLRRPIRRYEGCGSVRIVIQQKQKIDALEHLNAAQKQKTLVDAAGK